MKIGRQLKVMRNPENGSFIKMVAEDLESDGHSFVRKTARRRHTRDSR